MARASGRRLAQLETAETRLAEAKGLLGRIADCALDRWLTAEEQCIAA
jgi:hypothetical protein